MIGRRLAEPHKDELLKMWESHEFHKSSHLYKEGDMIEVSEVRYQEGYKIWLKFNTGENGVVDLSDLIARYDIAKPLCDIDEFKKFYLDGWPTLAWHCGFDVAPESLYERVTGRRLDWQSK